MAKYRIQAPDGQTYEIEGPEGATDDQVRAEVLRQHPAAAAAASAQAQSYDGGSTTPAPANDAVSAPPGSSGQPAPVSVPRPASEGGGPLIAGQDETSFGDGAGKSGPNLRLAPEQENNLMSILWKGPLETSAQSAREYMASIGWKVPDTAFEDTKAARAKGMKPGWLAYDKPTPLDTGGNDSTDALALGVASDIPGFNKLAAAGNAAEKFVRGEGDGFARDYYSQLDRIEATNEKAQGDHPYFYGGGQLAGLLAIPTDAPAVAAKAGLEAGSTALRAGKTMEEARAAAQRAYRVASGNRSALELATYGGAHGAGDADNVPDAITGGLTEAAAGAAGGKILGDVGARIFGGSTPAAVRNAVTPGQDVMAAAGRLDQFLPEGERFDLLPADVGGPATRRATSMTAQTIAGGSPIINASKRMIDKGRVVLSGIANSVGGATDLEAAGVSATEGARNWIKRSSTRIGKIYDNAADLSRGATLELPAAKAEVDAQIARLSAIPGADVAGSSASKALAEAKVMRQSLDGKFGVQGVRDMRTEMFVEPELRGTATEARMKSVVNAASTDIEAGLRKSGMKAAADAFKAADAQWAARIETIDNFIRPIIGKNGEKSGEQVMSAVEAASRGNNKKLEAFLGTLEPEERGMVSASLINRLGSRASNQGEGGSFSFETFLTNWDKLSPGAKRTLFSGETKAALDDLSKVAGGVKEAQSYANRSNTGGALGNMATLGLGLAGLPKLVAAVGAQYGIGRLLASPRFARWLAKAPKTQLSRTAYIERLSRIARAEPQLANDIFGLQRQLTDAFSGTVPLRAAANEDAQEPGVVNGNAGQDQSQYEGAQP